MLRKKIIVVILALIFVLHSFGGCSLITETPVKFKKQDDLNYSDGFNKVDSKQLSSAEAAALGYSYNETDSYYDEDYEVSFSKVKSTASYDELCTFNVNSDIFYPGALLDFNTMTPIEVKRAPLTFTLNGLEGGGTTSNENIYCTVDDPTLANVNNGIKNLVNQTLKSEGSKIPANLTMDIRKIESAEEFDLNLGFGVNVGKFHVNDEFDLTKSKKTTHIAVVLKQVYFTVAVSRENDRGGASILLEKYSEWQNKRYDRG